MNECLVQIKNEKKENIPRIVESGEDNDEGDQRREILKSFIIFNSELVLRPRAM